MRIITIVSALAVLTTLAACAANQASPETTPVAGSQSPSGGIVAGQIPH